MNSVIYNIPANMISDYRGRRVTVRVLDPDDLVERVSTELLDDVESVQLLSPKVDPDALTPLAGWGPGVPLDIVLNDPAAEFALLYNFSHLLDKHPIRASIAVQPGFSKAVKQAIALNFAVKLDVRQPGGTLLGELKDVLDLYLHRSSVSQPVEFFHSVFISFYREQLFDLALIQEEDPEYFCFVSDHGVETFPPRFAGADASATGLSNRAPECDSCEFMASCRGYFKWPDRTYSCHGLRSIFGRIGAEAAELREHLANFTAVQKGVSP